MTKDTGKTIIKTKDVKKWFGDFQALDGISMEI